MNPMPQLRDDLLIVEQRYRGEQTYIVKDPLTHKYFRFRPIDVMVMQALDGRRTLAAAAAALGEEGLPIAESKLAGFAQTLSKMGLLVRSVRERSVLELERLRAERRSRRRPPLFRGTLLRMRWSVGDPDALLDRLMPKLGFFFTPAFFAITGLLLAAYLLVLVLKWAEFKTGFATLYSPSLMTPGKLTVIVLTSFFIIGVHELGHAVACKHFGGRVHEIGAMLIYFMPAFFCNVNDAWTFPERKARLYVTAAGSWIQLVLAGIAAIVWWAVQPGTLVSDIALTAVVVGGATTVLTNANPLISLDGYYALSDWLEIPNLRKRAMGYASWLFRTKVLRLDAPEPPAAADERRVFMVYGALALAYSGAILTILALTAYGWIRTGLGTAAGIAFLAALLLLLRGKLLSGWRVLRAAGRQQAARWRESSRAQRIGAAAALGLLLLLLVPWPVSVSARFVAVPPLSLALTAPEDAVVAQVVAREGLRVAAGTPLVRLRNPDLERGAVTAARLADSLAQRADVARAAGDAGAAAQFDAEHAGVEAAARALAARAGALTVRSLGDGVVLTARPEQLTGRRVPAGATLLAIGDTAAPEAVVPLAGAGATLVRPGQPVRLALSDGRWARGVVSKVSPAADGGHGEARIIPEASAWRHGSTGTARITIRQSNLAGAAWWRLRSGIRSDLLF